MSLTIWISGISASGKTTLGSMLKNKLLRLGYNNIIYLDGDELRNRSPREYGHSIEDRYKQHKENIQIIIEEFDKGKIVIVSQVSHKRNMRDDARKKISSFFEVNLYCSPNVCAKRDIKNQYKKALDGQYDCFPGVTEKYEMSNFPELIIDTEKNDIKESFNILLREVKKRLYNNN